MANIKSARKRVIVNEQQRVKNQAFKSSMRTVIKEYEKKLNNNDIEAAKNLLPLAVQKLDKAVSKKMIHKNNAARTKSRLQQRLDAATQ
ncbi:30S ribosomal protein S20 [Salsuginibacillus kocurii]|uniref:30S ribosomal protein S20 n=1 Tax=Salsuginibacillus kocurii TaxID=427078 RepID=UPI0003625858|nr:30S ribosomal protein S20 [Salsuginibacillus kocurii]